MIEKLTASITFKCTDEEKLKLERIARSRKLNGLSELMRLAGIDIIHEVEEMLKSLQAEFDLTTDTVDTRNTSDFELMPSPPIRSKSQKTGTKKVQLLQQKDIFAVHSD
ncbi:hypothetical protein [Acinetobacter sp.]|uniref:hypothetical protein n=1 Tax=Acinetobacter sp. TaxID=472 RepID=UPI00291535F3|nr:hypothetical protein [Acinetobacter sp.]MDU5771900.1 hypothetical protein [Acinetobacter sp.]